MASYLMPLTMAVHFVGSNQPIRCATVYFGAKPRRASQPVIDAAWDHSITWPHHLFLRLLLTHTLPFPCNRFPGVPERSHFSEL